MELFLQKAKSLTTFLATMEPKRKNTLLWAMADALEAECEQILKANAFDMETAKENNLDDALQDRLRLDKGRVGAMAQAVREIASLKEPVGRVLEGWVVPSGLRIEKVSIPIGVVAIIYESRPNVTSDTAALCFKSGNVCVLKGGKEAKMSNQAIASVLQKTLALQGVDPACISLLPDDSREGVATLIRHDRYVDLVVPRGGEGLIRFVSQNATVPVVKHDKGVCHTYVDASANTEEALAIILNAKCQRPSACNALETLLVHASIAPTFLPIVFKALGLAGTAVKGCLKTRAVLPVPLATEEDFHTEHLSNALNIKIVQDTEEAIRHIQTYGSSHSEAILTEHYATAEYFLNAVDAACVYVNASTRFTDGGEFGFGAEVGISTNKLHARGPMGINELTTYKFKVYGKGNVRG